MRVSCTSTLGIRGVDELLNLVGVIAGFGEHGVRCLRQQGRYRLGRDRTHTTAHPPAPRDA